MAVIQEKLEIILDPANNLKNPFAEFEKLVRSYDGNNKVPTFNELRRMSQLYAAANNLPYLSREQFFAMLNLSNLLDRVEAAYLTKFCIDSKMC